MYRKLIKFNLARFQVTQTVDDFIFPLKPSFKVVTH